MGGGPRVQAPAGSGGDMLRDSALSLVPETLDLYVALGKAIWASGPLQPAELEVARLRNARRVNCVFCRNVRYDIARADGLDESRVALIDEAYADSALGERDKLIIAFVDQYLTAPAQMPAHLRDDLARAFTAAEVAHLSLAVAYFSGFSRCAVALGGMPEEMPLMEISVPQ